MALLVLADGPIHYLFLASTWLLAALKNEALFAVTNATSLKMTVPPNFDAFLWQGRALF